MIKELTMEKTSLPVGWEMKTLGEVSAFSQGIQVGLKNHITKPKDGYVRFIRIIDYTQNTEDIRYVPNPGEKYFVDEDDIVMVRYGSPGLIGRGKSGVIANNLFRIKINVENLTNDYLSHFLSQHKIQKYLSSQGSATMPALNFGQLKTVDVLFPKSIPQQKQIVATLNKAFAAIDSAKANAEQNLQNAKELFESYLHNVFENKGDDWEEKTLEQIADDFGRGKSKHRPRNDKKLYGGNYPFIQTGDIRNSEHFITDFSQTYNETGLAQSKLWPKGTICITIAANIAETGILSFDACFPDSVIGIVVDSKQAKIDYVEYLLQYFKVNIQSLSQGSAQENINLGTFEGKLFPFASLEEQIKIVQKLDFLSTKCKKLESIYTQKTTDLEELKKSVLQKAFSGQLNTIN